MILAPALQIVGYAFLACLVVRAIFSWFEPYPRNQIHRFTFQITEPVIAPVRRILPPMGGFDISFTIVMFAVLLLVQLVCRIGV